jgi:c(7)-type cytochrome triheme protein
VTTKRSRLLRFFAGAGWLLSLCCFWVLCVSVVSSTRPTSTTETQELHRGIANFPSPQGPELDYANFKHASARHASLGCNSCHQRSDNSATPRFPGHRACTSCHLAQFVTPQVPMCVICHTDVNSANPPLKNFPASFSDNFNVRFDHSQHMTRTARPPSGCNSCHTRVGARAAGLAIPNGLGAHNQCYTCHTPSSKSSTGKEIASCAVCHEQRPYARSAVNARAFRFAFSHAKHGPGQRLACADCHRLSAGVPQGRQVSSPAAAEHFPATRSQTCSSCHNGTRAFGGDLNFRDCRRCHSAATFKMPL